MKWKSAIKTIAQIVFFVVLAKAADFAVELLRLPVPGSIVGIVALFVLLKLGIIKLEWIELGSKWLLAEMLLFFIPATVGIVNYKSLVVQHGISIAFVILCSTFIVMLCAGLTGEWMAGRKEREAQ